MYNVYIFPFQTSIQSDTYLLSRASLLKLIPLEISWKGYHRIGPGYFFFYFFDIAELNGENRKIVFDSLSATKDECLSIRATGYVLRIQFPIYMYVYSLICEWNEVSISFIHTRSFIQTNLYLIYISNKNEYI